MRHLAPLFLLAAALAGPAAASAQLPEPLQAVAVVTADWDATTGVLQRFERAAAGEAWRAVGEPFRVTVGRTGVAWGVGLHPTVEGGDGPVKREGDGKSPAGVFALSGAFGYAPEAPWIRLPYLAADENTECVDDMRSRWYNLGVDRRAVPSPDWNSHEEMRRGDELYRLGVWVDHNTAPQVPGRGSCIFLHIWAGPTVPTSGCTAMTPASIEALLRWLDPRARPVLVQLPAAEYDRRAAGWDLPRPRPVP